MATGFFALLDDIANLLDDIAVLAKTATKKTAGVLGDDLALNANQLAGTSASRELPIIWAVMKGALLNKVIIVPIALLLSAFYQPAIIFALLVGGAYLCFEGIEKLFFHHQESEKIESEEQKIKNAIRTDFILSLEIVIIALGELISQKATLNQQIITLSIVAVGITFLIYGLVAVIIKMDDFGLFLKQRNKFAFFGDFLLWFAPKILKALSIIGTLAMFLVGGHIWVEHTPIHNLPIWDNLLSLFTGLLVGFICYAFYFATHKIKKALTSKK